METDAIRVTVTRDTLAGIPAGVAEQSGSILGLAGTAGDGTPVHFKVSGREVLRARDHGGDLVVDLNPWEILREGEE